jgi:hypothetical protein
VNLYRLLAVAILVVAAVAVVDRCHRASLSEWEREVARVQAQVEGERERAAAAQQAAAVAHERAASLASELERRAPEIRERIVEVQVETPEHLRDEPAIVQRDSIITELRNESDGWRSAFEAQRAAYVELRGALRIVESSRDSLVAVLRERPGARPWYLPRLGVGPFVGMCARGAPCAGPVAVSLTWELRL